MRMNDFFKAHRVLWVLIAIMAIFALAMVGCGDADDDDDDDDDVETPVTPPPPPPSYPLGSEQNPIALTAGEWYDGEVEEVGTTSSDVTTGAIWFSFDVEDGDKITVFWDDAYSSGSGDCTADICVAAKYQGDSSFTIFGMGPASQNGSSSSNRGVDNGYTDVSRPNSTFTADGDGTVLVRVLAETASGTTGTVPGTFGIIYAVWTGSTQPSPRITFPVVFNTAVKL